MRWIAMAFYFLKQFFSSFSVIDKVWQSLLLIDESVCSHQDTLQVSRLV